MCRFIDVILEYSITYHPHKQYIFSVHQHSIPCYVLQTYFCYLSSPHTTFLKIRKGMVYLFLVINTFHIIVILRFCLQSVPITTKVVSANLAHGEVYSIQHYVIKFVSDLWQVSGFLRVLWFPPPITLTTTK